MARGRMLAKSISTDPVVSRLSCAESKLLYTWSIAHLDCEGRLTGEPEIFRGCIAPREEIKINDIERFLQEWHDAGLVFRYTGPDEDRYLYYPGFDKNQPGLRKEREAPSSIPPPPEEFLQEFLGVAPADKSRTKSGKGPAKVRAKFKYKSKLKSKNIHRESEDKNGGDQPAQKKIHPNIQAIFDHWQKTLNHPRAQLGDKAQGYIKARLKEGYTVQDCKEAIDGCKASTYHMGENDQGKIYDALTLIFRDCDKVEQFRGYLRTVSLHDQEHHYSQEGRWVASKWGGCNGETCKDGTCSDCSYARALVRKDKA